MATLLRPVLSTCYNKNFCPQATTPSVWFAINRQDGLVHDIFEAGIVWKHKNAVPAIDCTQDLPSRGLDDIIVEELAPPNDVGQDIFFNEVSPSMNDLCLTPNPPIEVPNPLILEPNPSPNDVNFNENQLPLPELSTSEERRKKSQTRDPFRRKAVSENCSTSINSVNILESTQGPQGIQSSSNDFFFCKKKSRIASKMITYVMCKSTDTPTLAFFRASPPRKPNSLGLDSKTTRLVTSWLFQMRLKLKLKLKRLLWTIFGKFLVTPITGNSSSPCTNQGTQFGCSDIQ
ncbi:unnamed protein product [Nesidiocoris tenuis]|uniref:Uncharacterized protein n=1 Tax=Nesidiocoris tenuis TaxID=355587 RepID=A0A6H5HDV3_9HEMI|nr:unnamed protein product [Nesidiocoris tenuis]